jgi:hypothetical protein
MDREAKKARSTATIDDKQAAKGIERPGNIGTTGVHSTCVRKNMLSGRAQVGL